MAGPRRSGAPARLGSAPTAGHLAHCSGQLSPGGPVQHHDAGAAHALRLGHSRHGAAQSLQEELMCESRRLGAQLRGMHMC